MKWTQKTIPGCQRLLAEKKMMNTLRLNYCGDYEEENVTMMVDDDLEQGGQYMMIMMMIIMMMMIMMMMIPVEEEGEWFIAADTKPFTQLLLAQPF